MTTALAPNVHEGPDTSFIIDWTSKLLYNVSEAEELTHAHVAASLLTQAHEQYLAATEAAGSLVDEVRHLFGNDWEEMTTSNGGLMTADLCSRLTSEKNEELVALLMNGKIAIAKALGMLTTALEHYKHPVMTLDEYKSYLSSTYDELIGDLGRITVMEAS